MAKDPDIFYLFLSGNNATWSRAKGYKTSENYLSDDMGFTDAFGFQHPWKAKRMINNIPLAVVDNIRELIDPNGKSLNRRLIIVNADVKGYTNPKINDSTLSHLDVLMNENMKLKRQVNELTKQLFGLGGGDKLHELMQSTQKAYGGIRREGKDFFNPYQTFGTPTHRGIPPAYGGPSSPEE